MVEANRREADFLSRDLPGVLSGQDRRLLLRIGCAVLWAKQRDLAGDLERVMESLEKPTISGEENIPTDDSSPLIVVCNHLSPKDILLGVAFTSGIFAKVRKGAGLPTCIRWMIAANIPEEDLPFGERMLLNAANVARDRFIKTYGFIPVPIGTKRSSKLVGGRMRSMFTAVKYLDSKILGPTIGISPEGGEGFDPNSSGFYDGVGQLARLVKNPSLKILPVGLSRDKKGLRIRFGQVIPSSELKHLGRKKATEIIREKIQALTLTLVESPDSKVQVGSK